jgi:hypothetical protein
MCSKTLGKKIMYSVYNMYIYQKIKYKNIFKRILKSQSLTLYILMQRVILNITSPYILVETVPYTGYPIV